MISFGTRPVMQAATSRSPICGPSEYYGYAFDQQPPIKDVAELLENHAVRVTVRSGEFSGAALRVTRLPK